MSRVIPKVFSWALALASISLWVLAFSVSKELQLWGVHTMPRMY